MPKGLYRYISSNFNFLSSILEKAVIQILGNKCNKQEKITTLWVCGSVTGTWKCGSLEIMEYSGSDIDSRHD